MMPSVMSPRAPLEKDYYGILGVRPEAGEEEIRRAFRRLALEWHPDRRPGDPRAAERFKEISEAYAVLMDPAKRREYDLSRRPGSGTVFSHRRQDLLRDLFANPRASAIFEELAREFERMGMRVDRHYFHDTLFGGRVVVTGGMFIFSPLTAVLALFQIVGAALRAAGVLPAAGTPEAPALPERPGLLGTLGRLGRRLLGLPPGPTTSVPPLAPDDVTIALRLTAAEAERGGHKRVTLKWVRGPEDVLVKIPPGIQPGTRLRLRGKGKPRPDGSRADAYLEVQVESG
jgi:curved DNA-binding protein CbpA